MRCEGKIVLVTGAQRGIGRAVALRFAREGAHVALNFLDDKPAAEAAAAEIAALGRRCCTIGADVSKPEEARRLVAEVERGLGPIDVLVNNAGIFPRAAFLELDEAQWDAVLDTNLKGTFVCSQEAARRMVAAYCGRSSSSSWSSCTRSLSARSMQRFQLAAMPRLRSFFR